MFAGIAFPTCVSVNNCVCHFSPLNSEPDILLNDGDLVKMYSIFSNVCLNTKTSIINNVQIMNYNTLKIICRDLGAHIDGYIAVVAHTTVVGASAVN